MSDDWGNDPIQDTPVASDWGNDPLVAPAVKFSEDAIRRAVGRPGSVTVHMDPHAYLALTPEFVKNPKTDKKGADLQKSLNRGDEVDEVPGLEVVVGKDGTARVTDQDGRHRAQAAIDAGLTEIPVVVQRFGDKAPIKSLVGMRDGAQPIPFNFKPVTPPPLEKPTPQKPGFLDRLKDAVYVPKAKRQDKTFKDAVIGGLEGIPAEIGRQASQAGGELLRDLAPPTKENALQYLQNAGGPLPGAKPVMDAASLVLSPLTGAITSAVGRPVEEATGVRREITGNVLSALVPLGSGAKAEKAAKGVEDTLSAMTPGERLYYGDHPTSPRLAALDAKMNKTGLSHKEWDEYHEITAKRAKDGYVPPASPLAKPAVAPPTAEDFAPAERAAHGEKVNRLRAAGVEPTAGQAQGGIVRRAEEASTSDPMVGEAVRSQQRRALESFNRALYNKVLAPLGISLKNNVPVGRSSVKVIGEMVSKAYESIKPRMRLALDDKGLEDLANIRTEATELPQAQEAQYENIINNRVVKRLATGEMDGATFKEVESELTTLARTYKNSTDGAQRLLGSHIEDALDALRDNMERTSDPGIRDQLKNINKAHAMLVRLEDASIARKGSGGVVSPGDLLGSLKKLDKTARKRGFARGDSLLQEFAEDAHDVLGPTLGDSGTAERLNMTHHGLINYLIGRVTNPVANMGMNMLRRSQAHIPTPQNSLLHPQLLRRAPTLAIGNIPNALNQAPSQ